MELLITGNKESFYLRKEVEFIDMKISGDFSHNPEFPLSITYGNFNFNVTNRDRLFQISEEVKGATKDRVMLIGAEIGFTQPFIDKLKMASTTEFSLLSTKL